MLTGRVPIPVLVEISSIVASEVVLLSRLTKASLSPVVEDLILSVDRRWRSVLSFPIPILEAVEFPVLPVHEVLIPCLVVLLQRILDLLVGRL